ncbi:MAG TPA: FkbM family methyltransferase [Acidimicrobiales bacterium]
MDAPDSGWRSRAKTRLKPLRDRVVRRLGGTFPERGLTYEQVVHLLYPTLPAHRRAAVDEAGAGDLSQVETIRRMRGAVEHQDAPTPFSVQITRDEAVRCTVGPVELLCDPADGAVAPGLRSGSYEPHLTAVFERLCKPGMTVVDVGANLGYFTLLASQLVGPAGRVIAVEPNSDNCRLLLSTLQDQGLTNIDLLPVACDAGTGWAYYSSHVGSNGGLVDDRDLLARPGVVVPTFRLDDLVQGSVGLLKLDVEGAEGRVVRGATGIIERDRPIVTSELKQEMLQRVSEMSLADYLGYFERLGYRATMLDAATGTETPYPTMAALLRDWTDLEEIADVLLLPDEAGSA